MRKPNRRAAQAAKRNGGDPNQQLPVNLTLTLPIAEVLAEGKWQIERWAAEAGLRLMRSAMEMEVAERAGEHYGRNGEAYRWGSQPGYVMFAGQKMATERPRIRSKESGREVPLASYGRFQQDVRLEQAVLDQMALGMSTRNYERSIGAFCDGYGIKKSSVSRRFIDASRKALEQLMTRKLAPLKVVVVFIDGIQRGGECLVVAVGVDGRGSKHALGLWQGATENQTIVKALLENLIERGLDPTKKYLFVLDGGKALSSSVRRLFAGSEIQRCQLHKRRNVKEHLPPDRQADVERRMKAAYYMYDYREAKAALLDVVSFLEKINPSAARSLEEGLEETLTLHRLKLPELLRRSLSTTNIVESSLSRVGDLVRRVKRWRGGDHVQRWTATGLLVAEKKFRTIKGHKSLIHLLHALGRSPAATMVA